MRTRPGLATRESGRRSPSPCPRDQTRLPSAHGNALLALRSAVSRRLSTIHSGKLASMTSVPRGITDRFRQVQSCPYAALPCSIRTVGILVPILAQSCPLKRRCERAPDPAPGLRHLFFGTRGDEGVLTPTKSRNLFNGIQKHHWTILLQLDTGRTIGATRRGLQGVQTDWTAKDPRPAPAMGFQAFEQCPSVCNPRFEQTYNGGRGTTGSKDNAPQGLTALLHHTRRLVDWLHGEDDRLDA